MAFMLFTRYLIFARSLFFQWSGHGFYKCACGSTVCTVLLVGAATSSLEAADLSKNRSITADSPAARLKGLGTNRPDAIPLAVNTVREASDLNAASTEAVLILDGVVREAPAFQAVHALTFLLKSGNTELLDAARTRLTKETTPAWDETHVQLGAMQALAVLGGEKFPDRLEPLISNSDSGVQMRAMLIARTSGDRTLMPAIERIATLGDSREVREAAEQVRTDLLSQGEKNSKLPTPEAGIWMSATQVVAKKIESDGIVSESLSRSEKEERLKQMVLSRQHDERMAAIEILATTGSEGAKGWLRWLGKKDTWQLRLVSAYALLIEGNKAEAQVRLAEEEHPIVQIALLSVLTKDDTKE